MSINLYYLVMDDHYVAGPFGKLHLAMDYRSNKLIPLVQPSVKIVKQITNVVEVEE